VRILAVTPYYEPEGGGLERYAHAVLSRLVARGHTVVALSFTRDGPGVVVRDGVAVDRLAPRLSLGNTAVHPAFRSHVVRAIRASWPDVVVAHTPVPFAAEMAYLAARASGVPFVLTYHAGRLRGSSHLRDRLATLDRNTLERQMILGASRLIAVGPYVRDHALALRRDEVDLVPPGVDARRFAPGGDPDPANVLFVGPLDDAYRWKGVDVLWEAFRRLRRRRPQARLTLVGDGDRRAELERRAQAEGLPVTFRGRVPDDLLVDEYRRAALVVLPSTSEAESFGMVLAEANACGRPVVASRIGGLPDFVRDGDNGLLAQPDDPDDLAEKIGTLLDDPNLAAELGMRGRERVLREHDWDALTASTERILEEAARVRIPVVA
jgi:glycosyltransferase involved in cell wall biosynthesis